MKYEQPTFTVGQPSRVTACERCVYASGEHAAWCESGRALSSTCIKKMMAACGDLRNEWPFPITVSEAVPPNEVWVIAKREQWEP